MSGLYRPGSEQGRSQEHCTAINVQAANTASRSEDRKPRGVASFLALLPSQASAHAPPHYADRTSQHAAALSRRWDGLLT